MVTSELEVGRLINNVKQEKGFGRFLNLSVAKESFQKDPVNKTGRINIQVSKNVMASDEETQSYGIKQNSQEIKRFEYAEAAIDEEIEECFKHSCVLRLLLILN